MVISNFSLVPQLVYFGTTCIKMAHRFLEKGRDGEEGSRVKREGVGRVEERTHTLTRGGREVGGLL